MIWTMKAASDDRLYCTILLVGCHSAPVLLHQLGCQFLRRNKLLEQYLIQPPAKTPFSSKPSLFASICKDSFVNHCIKMPVALYVTFPLFARFLKGCNQRDAFKLPSLTTLLLHLSVCVVIEDAMFYWSHRLLHTPFLFKHVHRKHHEFHNLSAMPVASEYTHPVESCLGNILPVLVGPFVAGCNFATLQVWLWLRMLKTADAHCGYALPFSPFGFGPLNEARRHDFHHEKGVGSFGSFFKFWDQVCGTDSAYLSFRKKKEEKEAERKRI